MRVNTFQPVFQPNRTIANALACAMLLAMSVFVLRPANADVKVSVPTPPVATIVTPLVGDVKVERKIRVFGEWPDSCPPISASLDTAFSQFTRTINVRLLLLLTSVPCPREPRSYSYELSWTPTVPGITKVDVYATTGGGGESYRATNSIVVAPEKTVWAYGDISGLWYDPDTAGSGLTFIHNYRVSNVVFGTWYVYDNAGLPRWYSLQEGVWKNNGEVLEGKLLESRGAPCVATVLTIAACPTTVIPPPIEVGTFRATFRGLGNVIGGPVTATIDAIAPNGAVLFSSQIKPLSF
jgi:hypothetical protein